MHPHRIAILAASIAASGIAGIALAADPPVLKAGLWEVWRVTAQQPDKKHLTTMCLDDSVQAEMREFGMGIAKEMCSQNDRRTEGNRMIITATCNLGPTTMKTRSVMTFNGNSSYHTESTATYDPPLMNMTESSSKIDGKWTGPCKPGQQPGDITTETGQTINMKAIVKK
jgi:hypothetical protein